MRVSSHPRKPPLPALTGIRTLLAISIMLFHFTPAHLGPLYPIINSGFVFIGFFFLISGFILTYNYADRAHTLVKRDFWIARFSRLYPVYAFSLLLFARNLGDEWHYHSHADFWRGMILTPLLLQGWYPWLATFWNTVAWTLSCEVMLYIAFPWVIRWPWPKTVGRLVGLLLALWAIGLIPHTIYLYLNPDHLSAPADRYTSAFWIRMLKYTPGAYICTFLAGITLGKLHLLAERDERRRLDLALTGFLLAVVFFYSGAAARMPYILMHGGLMTPIFAIMILGLSGRNVVAKVFSWRPLVVMGEATYCLYLLHFNTFIMIQRYHLAERLHFARFEPWVSYVVVTLFALAAYQYVEQPARRWILARWGKPRMHPMAVPAVSS